MHLISGGDSGGAKTHLFSLVDKLKENCDVVVLEVGMGGAMTAVGADPSAVLDNPAGLGLYRRCEIMLSLEENIDKTAQSATPSPNVTQRLRFSLPHVSAIWAWGNPTKQRGLIYSNVMLSVNRLASFNRDVVVNGQDLGLATTICNITNDMGGLSEESLQNKPWRTWLCIIKTKLIWCCRM